MTESNKMSLIEIKKIINILNTWGNVLVPGFGDYPQVKAKEKLEFLIKKIMVEEEMTIEQIEEELNKLESEVNP